MTTSYAATRSDTSRKVSSAWAPFVDSLSVVLEQLQEDQFLILSAKGTNRFVQFYAQGAFGMRAESVSNEYLRGRDRLEVAQIARLGELGWLSPSGNSRTSTPQNDPDGSPNHYINIAAPVPSVRCRCSSPSAMRDCSARASTPAVAACERSSV